VRFVSHEIRTPMNAVKLGMTLFASEIDLLCGKMEGKSLEDVMGVLQVLVLIFLYAYMLICFTTTYI
jgi:signal transduction histidine kinase